MFSVVPGSVIERSAQARLLAASGAKAGEGEKFVPTARDHRDGASEQEG